MGGESVFEVAVSPGEYAFLWAAVLADIFDGLVRSESAGYGERVVVVAFTDAFCSREVEEDSALERVVVLASEVWL